MDWPTILKIAGAVSIANWAIGLVAGLTVRWFVRRKQIRQQIELAATIERSRQAARDGVGQE